MAKAAKRTGRSETRQVAALPWRRGEAGLEILMITSRETRRWVIPKGGRMAGKTDAEAAAQAAADSVHEADLALLIRDFAATPPSD